MKKLALLGVLALSVALLAVPAGAAESYLGTIVVTDAGVVHNLLPLDGGAFAIPAMAKITVQPNAAAYLCVEQLTTTKAPTCSAVLGVKVAADVAFPTSCGPAHYSLQADAGSVLGCVVAVMPVSGTSVTATVLSRKGDEF